MKNHQPPTTNYKLSGAPIVSVIMPAWNQARYVSRSIEGVLKQSLKNLELIVINDGSTDNTREVVASFMVHDPRVIYFENDKNRGIPYTFNRGVEAARGKYIARVDSDDAWIGDDKLERQVAFLESHPDYVGVGGGMIVVDPGGKELYRYFKEETDEAIRRTALVTNPIASSTGLYRTDAVRRAGGFNLGLNYNEDWDFSLKTGLLGKLYNFPAYFSYYTSTGENRSSKDMLPHTLKAFRVIWRYRGKYPGFWHSFFLNSAQLCYALIPFWIRKRVHILLWPVKKFLSGRVRT